MIDFPSDFSPDTALPIPLATRFISAEVSFFAQSETSLQKKLSILQKIRETIEGISANGSIGKSLGSVEGLNVPHNLPQGGPLHILFELRPWVCRLFLFCGLCFPGQQKL